MPKLERENTILSAKVEQLESEAEILKWYSHMVDVGIDTKNLVVKFQDLQEEHQQLVQSHKKAKAKFEDEVEDLKFKLK